MVGISETQERIAKKLVDRQLSFDDIIVRTSETPRNVGGLAERKLLQRVITHKQTEGRLSRLACALIARIPIARIPDPSRDHMGELAGVKL